MTKKNFQKYWKVALSQSKKRFRSKKRKILSFLVLLFLSVREAQVKEIMRNIRAQFRNYPSLTSLNLKDLVLLARN